MILQQSATAWAGRVLRSTSEGRCLATIAAAAAARGGEPTPASVLEPSITESHSANKGTRKKHPPPPPPPPQKTASFNVALTAVNRGLARLPLQKPKHSLLQHLLVSALKQPNRVHLDKLAETLRQWRQKHQLPVHPLATTNAIRLATMKHDKLTGAGPFMALEWLTDPAGLGLSPRVCDLEHLLRMFVESYPRESNVVSRGDQGGDGGGGGMVRGTPVSTVNAVLATLALFEQYALGAPTAKAYSIAAVACALARTEEGRSTMWTLLQEARNDAALRSVSTELLRVGVFLGRYPIPEAPSNVASAVEAFAEVVSLERGGGKAWSNHEAFHEMPRREGLQIMDGLRSAVRACSDPSLRKEYRRLYLTSRQKFGIAYQHDGYLRRPQPQNQPNQVLSGEPPARPLQNSKTCTA